MATFINIGELKEFDITIPAQLRKADIVRTMQHLHEKIDEIMEALQTQESKSMVIIYANQGLKKVDLAIQEVWKKV